MAGAFRVHLSSMVKAVPRSRMARIYLRKHRHFKDWPNQSLANDLETSAGVGGCGWNVVPSSPEEKVAATQRFHSLKCGILALLVLLPLGRTEVGEPLIPAGLLS